MCILAQQGRFSRRSLRSRRLSGNVGRGEKNMKQDMIELNFGLSQYVRNAPGEPLVDDKIWIPKEGALPEIGVSICASAFPAFVAAQEDWHGGEYCLIDFPIIMESDPTRTEVLGYPAICIVGDRRNVQVLFVWIESRGEWIAIYRSEWYEGPEGGNDVSYLGPFAIDRKCAEKLIAAYGSRGRQLSVAEIRKLSWQLGKCIAEGVPMQRPAARSTDREETLCVP